MHYFALLLCATCLTSAGAQDPTQQQTSPAATLPATAVDTAVELLLELQEGYVPDPQVGRMTDDELPAWQERERARLAQLRNGESQPVEWPYEGVYRTRGEIPAGYRIGGTAIVCMALVEAPGYASAERRHAAVQRATEFVLEQLEEHPDLAPGPKSGYDVRGWGHAYALELFLLALRRPVLDEPTTAEVRARVPHLIHCLTVNELPEGGWNYARSGCSPFMTGATLLALMRARVQGFEVDAGLLARSVRALEATRFDSGSFAYSGPAGTESKRSGMPGAAARASVAELALLLAGRSDPRRLGTAVDGFFEHWEELYARKSKQGTHEGPYGVAPYYFMFGHTYAALAIEYLPEAAKSELRHKLHSTLAKTREADGGWNDRIFPRSKSYATAMAILALCAPAPDRLPAPPARDRTVIR